MRGAVGEIAAAGDSPPAINGLEPNAKDRELNVSASKRQHSDAEKVVCSIEAMRNGEECEACQ
jgi:hypothetical protein